MIILAVHIEEGTNGLMVELSPSSSGTITHNEEAIANAISPLIQKVMLAVTNTANAQLGGTIYDVTDDTKDGAAIEAQRKRFREGK